jgi:pseudaminic acid synthase
MTELTIAGRPIGGGAPVFIVAELSANHRQRFEDALLIIDAAHQAGADAIKLQTYTADSLTLRSDAETFRIHGGQWDGRLLYELYAEASTPYEWHRSLFEHARSLGLVAFSSPFDAEAVDLLEELEAPVHKVASFEIVDIPLLRKIGSTGKPVILSTGMATEPEIDEALTTLAKAGAGPVALLKCTSGYPAPVEEMNLRSIPAMEGRFGRPVGLSDHSLDVAVPVAAVALGACIVEKHVTLSRAVAGPDSTFSLEPDELGVMVRAVRSAQRALGDVSYGPGLSEQSSMRLRRSLFVVRSIACGEPFSHENVRSIRPAGGLHPRHLDEIVHCRAAQNLEAGTPLRWEHVTRP